MPEDGISVDDVTAETRDDVSAETHDDVFAETGDDVSAETSQDAIPAADLSRVSAETSRSAMNGADSDGVSAETSHNGMPVSGTPADADDGFVQVATTDQIPEGTLLGIEEGRHRICLANVEGEIYALQDNCSHQDFPLSAGCLEDGRVECTWHGAKFDPASGRAVALPAIRPVKTYAVRVDGDAILVDLS